MKREEFKVEGMSVPISHYADAVRAGDLLFVSGCVPVDAEGNLVGGDDVVAQAERVFENIGSVLSAAGASAADVVKVTLFLTDIDDRPADGLKPTVPQHADGSRIEQPVSVPSPRSQSPAASAAALPPLDPPAVRPGWVGLRTVPYHSFWLVVPHANSCRFAFPTSTAPASSSACAAGAVRVGT